MESSPNTTEHSSIRTISASDTAVEATQPPQFVHQQLKALQVRPGKRLIVACDGEDPLSVSSIHNSHILTLPRHMACKSNEPRLIHEGSFVELQLISAH